MKIKNIIAFFSFITMANIFSVNAMDLDDLEKGFIGVSAVSYEKSETTEQKDDNSGIFHPITKHIFNGGDICKREFNDIWELGRQGNLSITKAHYIITISGKARIVEHFWNETNERLAQAYLCIKQIEGESSYHSMMVYRFIDPTYNNIESISRFLKLTFQIYAHYNGVPINTIQVAVPFAHMDALFAALSSEVAQGLQISPAA